MSERQSQSAQSTTQATDPSQAFAPQEAAGPESAQGQSQELGAAVEQKASPIEALKRDGATQSSIQAAADHFGLSALRAAHFFAQMAHESGDFQSLKENLNYSEDRLNEVFPAYFGEGEANAADYARQPEKLANLIYADRMGNGDEASGDGWKFRGRGAIQLTGRDNYQAFSESVQDPQVMEDPDLVADKYALESAKFYFDGRDIWSLCDQGVDEATITAVTKAVNGGTNGLEERIELTLKFYEWLGGQV